MKIQIITADTLGCIVKIPNDPDVYYVGGKIQEGFAYKSKAAFADHIGICYIQYSDFFDEIEMDENIPDEIYDLIVRKKVPSGAVTMDYGYTRDDLYEVVLHWAEQTDTLKDVDDKAFEDFVDYFTGVLFTKLTFENPENLIEDYKPWDEYQTYLQVNGNDPRLTKQQRKELGYE